MVSITVTAGPAQNKEVFMKQQTIKHLSGIIEVVTGLHIGAGNNAIEIGGMDNPVVRNPLTNKPYIPGSSLKGKMRSIAEWFYGKMSLNKETPGAVCDCGNANCKICRVFGTNAASTDEQRKNAIQRGPTRLIVRDAQLVNSDEVDVLIEEKWENTINRITATANPRQIERVVPGTQFSFDLSYRVISNNEDTTMDEEYFENVVLLSLYLLELDYLGGGGSRGNGKILFKSLNLDVTTEVKKADGSWVPRYKTKFDNLLKPARKQETGT